MIKLINIKQLEDNLVKTDALIEGKKSKSFEIVFNNTGDIISSTAKDGQNYYKAQARIAFRKYIGKEIPKEICSMWY